MDIKRTKIFNKLYEHRDALTAVLVPVALICVLANIALSWCLLSNELDFTTHLFITVGMLLISFFDVALIIIVHILNKGN